MKTIHFCGGLPRSGSTILMNILQQNPRIFTTGTCALPDLISNHILIKSRYRESFQAMSTEQADKAMYGLVHGATQGWFEGLTPKPIVISKNRGWSSIFHLYNRSKYIVMVRDLRDIVESFERVNDKILALHAYGDAGVFTPAMHQHEKYKHYFDEPNAFSDALQREVPRLMEVFKRTKNRVMFIRYEDFTVDPNQMLTKLYHFIEEEPFQHNLNKIEQSEVFEHDHAYFRERTDHKTLPTFRYFEQPVRTLPESFHNRILKEYRWFYEGFYPNELSTN
jgi:sulfotransferase